MADQLAAEQIARYEDLSAERNSQFMPTWQTLAQYFYPSQSSINVQKLPGTVTGWTDRIYDTSPIYAARVLASGQRNWLTPSSEPWAAYEPPEYLSSAGREEEKDEAAQWLANATEVAMRELARCNFYATMNVDYMQTGVFGTGMIYVEEGKRTTINTRQFKPWHLTIEENDEGVVDSVRREFWLTTRQAVQMFGVENLGPKIVKAWGDPKTHGKKWKFLHACFPREESEKVAKWLPKRADQKPIASVYIAYDDKKTVKVGGYDEMPYLCSRFESWGAETVWGYGPAYLAQPDARQINYVTQYRDALAELKAYPRLLYPDNLEGDVDLRAGGVTTFDSSNNAKPEEWMTVGDDKAAEQNVGEKRQAIDRMFYVNMFTMMEQLADKKMTAYEIAQRIGEKLEQFTPVFDRRVTEFLNPLMLRVFGILYRAGKFGDAPASLMVPVDGGKGYALATPQIAITSRISMALKALQNQAIVNTLNVLQSIAAQRPEVLDNFDLDKISRTLARNYGMSPDLIRSLTDLKKIRAERQQQMQEQRAAELAERMSASAGDLGKAPKQLQEAVVSQFSNVQPQTATG